LKDFISWRPPKPVVWQGLFFIETNQQPRPKGRPDSSLKNLSLDRKLSLFQNQPVFEKGSGINRRGLSPLSLANVKFHPYRRIITPARSKRSELTKLQGRGFKV
jgi:hypothetical protein